MPGPVLVPAEAGDDAVGRALVLDLEHRPLARLVRRVEPLGDDAVETGALEPVEPVRGGRPVARRRRQVDRRRRRRRGPPRAAPGARPAGRRAGPRRRARAGPRPRTRPATRSASILTRDAAGWMRSSSDSNSRPAVAGDDDLAVEDAALGQRGPERRRPAPGSSGRAASGRATGCRPRRRRGRRCARKPSHLGSNSQPSPSGSASDGLGQHRLERRLERQVEGHGRRVYAGQGSGRQGRPRSLPPEVPGGRAGQRRVRGELAWRRASRPPGRGSARAPGSAAAPRRGPGRHRRAGRPGTRRRGRPSHRPARGSGR